MSRSEDCSSLSLGGCGYVDMWICDTRKARHKSTGKEIGIDMDDVRPEFVNTLNNFPVDLEPQTVGKAKLVERLWSCATGELLNKGLQWRKSPEGAKRVMDRVTAF